MKSTFRMHPFVPLILRCARWVMRMEKGFLHWKADILTEFDPFETGLGRLVKMAKDDFVGKAALEIRQQNGPPRNLVSLRVACDHAPAHDGASLMSEGNIVGTVTSGDWGRGVNMNLAYAFVRPEFATRGTTVTIDIVGVECPAVVITSGP